MDVSLVLIEYRVLSHCCGVLQLPALTDRWTCQLAGPAPVYSPIYKCKTGQPSSRPDSCLLPSHSTSNLTKWILSRSLYPTESLVLLLKVNWDELYLNRRGKQRWIVLSGIMWCLGKAVACPWWDNDNSIDRAHWPWSCCVHQYCLRNPCLSGTSERI